MDEKGMMVRMLVAVLSVGLLAVDCASQRQGIKGSHSQQQGSEVQVLETVPVSEVEYVDGPLAPLYDFLNERKLYTFCKLLRDAAVDETIQQLGGTWTLFVPTDASFVFLPPGILDDIKGNHQLLQDFVLYHFVPGDIILTQLQNEMIVDSLQGSLLRFNIYGQIVTVSGARILESDLKPEQGTVYTIDHPLYPIPTTDTITFLGTNYREMYELLAKTGLLDYVSSGVFTLLVPDDEAFSHLTPELKEALATNNSLAERVALNHIIPATIYTGGITENAEWESAGGVPVIFTLYRGLVFVNEIPITVPDVPLTNGVIHVINRVILPDDIENDCQCKASDSSEKSSQAPGITNAPVSQTSWNRRPSGQTQVPSRQTPQPFQRQTPNVPRTPSQGRPQAPQVNPSISRQPTSGQRPSSPTRPVQPSRQSPPPSQPNRPIFGEKTTESHPENEINGVNSGIDSGTQINEGVKRPGQTVSNRYPQPPRRGYPPRSQPTQPQGIRNNNNNQFGAVSPSSSVTQRPSQGNRWSNRIQTPVPRYPTPARGPIRTQTTRRPQTTKQNDVSEPNTSLPNADVSPNFGITSTTRSPAVPFQRPTSRTTSWQQRKQATRQPFQQITTSGPSRAPLPPQRRPTEPGSETDESIISSLPKQTGQSFESNRQKPSCRARTDKVTPSTRNLPVCSESSQGECQNLPYDPTDPRPLCSEDCRDPNLPFDSSDNRPLCSSTAPPAQQNCRRSDEPISPQDRRPLCQSEGPQNCRPLLERPKPGDRRPVCKMNGQTPQKPSSIRDSVKGGYEPGKISTPQQQTSNLQTGRSPITQTTRRVWWQSSTQAPPTTRGQSTMELIQDSPNDKIIGKQPQVNNNISPPTRRPSGAFQSRPLTNTITPQSGAINGRQSGTHPSNPQSRPYPSRPQSGTFTSQPQSPQPQTGPYPGQPQSVPYPQQPQTRPYPVQPQTGSQPHSGAPVSHNGRYPAQLQPQVTNRGQPSRPQQPVYPLSPRPGARPQTSYPPASQNRQPPQLGSPQTAFQPQTNECIRCPNQANVPGNSPGSSIRSPFSPAQNPGSQQPSTAFTPLPGRQSTPRVPSSVTGTSTTPGEDTRRNLYELAENPALLIRGRPVKLSKIFSLFHKAGLEDILSGPGPITVFLPSDDAFAMLPKGVVDQLEENPDILRQVLLFHVTNSEILPSAQAESYAVPSMEGTQLLLTMLNGGRLILISGAKAVAVTRASNGIFYVINQLLYPLPHKDLVGAVQSRPDLSTLSSLLPVSGLTDMLQGETPRTLLAPTDNAFAQLPPVVYEELTTNTTALHEILLNHIVDGAHYGREFLTGVTFPSARGNKLKFYTISRGYQVNDIDIKTPEIVTGTGVIHLIDQLILDDSDQQYFTFLENSLSGQNGSPDNTVPINGGDLQLITSQPGQSSPVGPGSQTRQQQPGLPVVSGLQPFSGPQQGQRPQTPFRGRQPSVPQPQNPNNSFNRGRPLTSGSPINGRQRPAFAQQGSQGQRGPSSLQGAQKQPAVQTRPGQSLRPGSGAQNSNSAPAGIGQPHDVAELARSMGLNRFANWITNTGLLEKVHDGGVYTVFAPTDDAMNALPQEISYAVDSNPGEVKSLLQYHIVPQRININSVTNEETATTLLPGKSIRFNVYENVHPDCKHLVTASGTPVIEALATMGSIQVIPVTQVLYQQSGNLLKIIEASPILQKLSESVRAARLPWVLSGSGPLTFFAPSDTAFQSLTDEERRTLIEDKQAFAELLKRHLVRGTIFSSAVQEDLEKKSESGQPLTISLNEGIMTVNSIPVAYSDITATNGVLHVIDQFL